MWKLLNLILHHYLNVCTCTYDNKQVAVGFFWDLQPPWSVWNRSEWIPQEFSTIFSSQDFYSLDVDLQGLFFISTSISIKTSAGKWIFTYIYTFKSMQLTLILSGELLSLLQLFSGSCKFYLYGKRTFCSGCATERGKTWSQSYTVLNMSGRMLFYRCLL